LSDVSHPPEDHFSQVAEDYRTFRPRYPASLFEWLGSLTPRHDLAWDAGTGNGQSAVALAEYFDNVIATDFSAGQIANASLHPRVEYRVAPAEQSGAASDSVDLVTVAQALHWFDTARFFGEVQRVLVPSGVVAAWTYGIVRADQPAADQVLHDFYYHQIGPWWPENRKLVEEGYRSIHFPFTLLNTPDFQMKVRWSVPELTGYIGTWSAVSRYRKATGQDPVPDLARRLTASWGNPLERREIRWSLRVLAGVKSEG
jgi:ubiquinone/menaquinone biosynthesis C-methylase UbiE